MTISCQVLVFACTGCLLTSAKYTPSKEKMGFYIEGNASERYGCNKMI